MGIAHDAADCPWNFGRSLMSSELPYISVADVEHLSSCFRRLGCEDTFWRGSTQNGWDDDTDDLKEEDIWGGHNGGEQWNDSYKEGNREITRFIRSMETGNILKEDKGLKSRLSMELQAMEVKGHKKGHVGIGFADLYALQNGGNGWGKDTNGGWAPGLYVRKVKIPLIGGVRNIGYANVRHSSDRRGNQGGIPESAPISMPAWPAKCVFGDSNGFTHADVSVNDCSSDGQDLEDSDNDDDEDGDKNNGMHRETTRRLAPHEIVEREHARSRPTPFSMIEGAGRTLKGSDLCRVRNAVWSCTGFEG